MRRGLSEGTVIEATDRHPFWNAGTGAFEFAIDLDPGELVLTLDGSALEVTSVRVHEEDLTAYNLEIEGIHTYYAGDTPLLVHNTCDDFFRGARADEPVSFQAKPGEYRVGADGYVQPTHGVSVFNNAASVQNLGLNAHRLDMSTVSNQLAINQRGSNPLHFEIMPALGTQLTPNAFNALLSMIRTG